MLRATLLSLSLLSAGCLDMAGPDAGDFESIGGSLDGFYFQRALDVGTAVEVSERQLDGHFSPEWYAAYRFHAEEGKVVDILTWQDATWSDWWNDAKLTQLVFIWNPRAGSTNPNDPNNWSLLRYDTGWDSADGGCWNCFGADQRTSFAVPRSTDYLVVILTDADNYGAGKAHHSVIDYAGADAGKPGSISIVATYTSGAPASGVRVAVGDQAITTDARGRAKFTDLVPNVYTVKLGPNGWERQLDVWLLAGRSETRTVTLDHPL